MNRNEKLVLGLLGGLLLLLLLVWLWQLISNAIEFLYSLILPGGLLVVYARWLYKNRSVGMAKLAVAPMLWLGLCLAIYLLAKHIAQNLTVSGYTHNDAWVSMNDNPHPENWQVEFADTDKPFWFALAAPLLLMLVLRGLDRWQFRHFARLALVGWPMLLLSSCQPIYTSSYEYPTQAELPPIGSRVDSHGHPYVPTQ